MHVHNRRLIEMVILCRLRQIALAAKLPPIDHAKQMAIWPFSHVCLAMAYKNGKPIISGGDYPDTQQRMDHVLETLTPTTCISV